MNPTDVRDQLIEILTNIAPDADFDSVEDDESLREQFDLDSMDMLRFAQGIHAAMGLEVPELEQPKLDTVEGAVAWVMAQG